MRFILQRQGWILTHLDRFAALPPAPAADAPLPAQIDFLGVPHAISVTIQPGRRPTVVHGEQSLAITVAAESAARPALEGWLREAARFAIVAQVASRAAEMGVAYGRVAIRDQKTRWGSCSRAGNLNFNWRLVLAPAAVLDYVVVHELAHRVEMNHSARFWRLVAHHCPAYGAHRLWLRTNGVVLRF
ncbi:MAG: M48 family metallopeptidase [Thermomicrobia bacterium]|nr:M48 family metallopeptidase [Thermomicrobia bacterium]